MKSMGTRRQGSNDLGVAGRGADVDPGVVIRSPSGDIEAVDALAVRHQRGCRRVLQCPIDHPRVPAGGAIAGRGFRPRD